MKNKKGFTLVELLAIIVILAIISLIAVPIIKNVVESSKKQAAMDSTYGYVDAINDYQESSKLEDDIISFEDGTYKVGELSTIKMRGNLPSRGEVVIDDLLVKQANICILEYLVEYKDKKSSILGKCPLDEDLTPPVLLINHISTRTGSITLDFTVGDRESGIKSITCKATNNGNIVNGSITDNNKCRFSNLSPNTEYTYELKATNLENLSTTLSNTVKTIDFDSIVIDVEPETTWSTSKHITITGGSTGTTLQYQVGDVVDENNWQEYKAPFDLDRSTNVFARLWDGEVGTVPVSYAVGLIDTTAPDLTLGTVSSTTNTITINIDTNDDEDSHIKSTTCKATKDNNTYNGTISNNVCTITGLSMGTEYNYEVVTTNNANLSTTRTGTKSTLSQTTIIFNTNGGSSVSNITAAPGSTITLPTPTKTNYVFDGWYTALDGGTKITSATMPNSDTTYYAHWKPTLYVKANVGDYVRMTPTKSSYTTDTSKTGYSSSQTIYPQQLKLWRVIKKNSDGTIEMVSEYVSSTNVYFNGAAGYANFVGYLNTLAKQYENSTYTKGSRHMGYNGQTEYITNKAAFNGSSNNAPWTSDTTSTLKQKPTNESLGGGDTLYAYDTEIVQNALGTLVAVNCSNNTCSAQGSSTPYWLASRKYHYNILFDFCARNVLFGGAFETSIRYYNSNDGWVNNASSYALRPIIILKSGLIVNDAEGSQNDPFILG